MNDLVAFLQARYAERAAKARAAMHGGEGRWTQVDPDRYPGQVEDETREIVIYDEGRPSEEQAAHIAANDPASVLREVEAKRRMLDEHEPRRMLGWRPFSDRPGKHAEFICARCVVRVEGNIFEAEEHPCRTLRLLALPYADHPDYDPAWRI